MQVLYACCIAGGHANLLNYIDILQIKVSCACQLYVLSLSLRNDLTIIYYWLLWRHNCLLTTP